MHCIYAIKRIKSMHVFLLALKFSVDNCKIISRLPQNKSYHMLVSQDKPLKWVRLSQYYNYYNTLYLFDTMFCKILFWKISVVPEAVIQRVSFLLFPWHLCYNKLKHVYWRNKKICNCIIQIYIGQDIRFVRLFFLLSCINNCASTFHSFLMCLLA